jgi:nitroimidazol reductase NimA-like FMN-containing flavoprotein (pyridoxamine 5'-phosphate oxidase superfamily)
MTGKVVTTMTTTTRLQTLSREECRALLARESVGRLAVVAAGQPLIFPVNYVLSGSNVVFRTNPGTKLHAAIGRPVAFEIDGVDPLGHEGWSVLVTGTAIEESEPNHVRVLETLPLKAWGPGEKNHWIRIQGGSVSGRRLVHEQGES